MVRAGYKEGLQLFLAMACLGHSYEALKIVMFKLCLRYCMREHSCRG